MQHQWPTSVLTFVTGTYSQINSGLNTGIKAHCHCWPCVSAFISYLWQLVSAKTTAKPVFSFLKEKRVSVSDWREQLQHILPDPPSSMKF